MNNNLCKTLESSRVVGKTKEKSDCTVLAYSVASEIDYQAAHVELFLAGRKFKHGFRVVPFFNEKFGTPKQRPHMTVERYINTVAVVGRWIVLVRGHVFAVIDGVIHDLYPEGQLNKHVVMAWKVK